RDEGAIKRIFFGVLAALSGLTANSGLVRAVFAPSKRDVEGPLASYFSGALRALSNPVRRIRFMVRSIPENAGPAEVFDSKGGASSIWASFGMSWSAGIGVGRSSALLDGARAAGEMVGLRAATPGLEGTAAEALRFVGPGMMPMGFALMSAQEMTVMFLAAAMALARDNRAAAANEAGGCAARIRTRDRKKPMIRRIVDVF
ncbi:MAG TPA: hypothetical protein DEB40_06995, partial [Elusimicrobia bacterium]|nr:hypothetical protein [Elusimicrobiota bacterium]